MLVGLIVLALGLAAGALLAAIVMRPLRRLAAAARRAGRGRSVGARARSRARASSARWRRAFNEMTARVQRMVDAQRDFVADASHQLRTPLTGLRLRLEEAAATVRRARRAEQVEGALVEVDRLAGVVTELLVLSEAGAARPPDAATDLLAGARRAVERWSAARRRSSCAAAPALVRCTVADLDRILDVLIENAIDYGPRTSGSRSPVAPGRLEVADEGPGSRAGEEETIFARFHRGTVGRASRRRGTGLGLPIARELAVALARRPSRSPTARPAAPSPTVTLPLADGTTPNEPVAARAGGAA